MPTNDNAFKVMLQYHPEQFVQWLLPGAEYIETLVGELPRESLYADALLRVRYQGKEYVLHIELQTSADQTGLLIFTALLKDATLASVDVAIETISQVADPAERTNALNYLILFAMRKFGEEVIANHIKEHPMLDEYIIQSEWYQHILRRGKQEGKQEGEKIGEERGEKIGEKRAAQRMAQRALEGRFGTVPEDILAACLWRMKPRWKRLCCTSLPTPLTRCANGWDRPRAREPACLRACDA